MASKSLTNEFSQFAQALDFYLSEHGTSHVAELNRVACLPSTQETDDLLLGYALEGIRLAGTFGAYREATCEDVIVDEGRNVPVSKGDRIFVSFVRLPSLPLLYLPTLPSQMCGEKS